MFKDMVKDFATEIRLREQGLDQQASYIAQRWEDMPEDEVALATQLAWEIVDGEK